MYVELRLRGDGGGAFGESGFLAGNRRDLLAGLRDGAGNNLNVAGAGMFEDEAICCNKLC